MTHAAGCASTEYMHEGPGQPSERASGALPPGAVGVCKEPFSKRPTIVNPQLWDHAKPCNSRTPPSYVRLGYAKDGSAGRDPEAEQLVDRALTALRSGTKPEEGNTELLSAIRAVRSYAMKKDQLRTRVSREVQLEQTCDFTYLLNTMSSARARLKPNRPCTAEVFDPETRSPACLFDTSQSEGLWITSGWDCVTFTGGLGNEESCHRLCAFDDYCTRQVYCAAGDIDLLLCTMGVCIPEPRAGVY
ncbi:hypothetical protein [Chondromyces crocatus]|uniref:Uncharacterized protein n=1 Tax=Chondromyces crocatus TaxID=52 RepID=A0A0K1EHW0_CHOCO|nr:hypothetical protein [Chondromyces crocatus]AKT40444.1 uncharacterized protein CMC5_045970 [Chondromyces crocatus]